MSDKRVTIWGVISKCQTLMILAGGLCLWLSMLLLPGTAQAAISYVQTVGSTSSTSFGTTMVINVSSSITAGNSLIVTMALDQGIGGTLSCSDSQGNSYTTDLDENNGIMRSVTCSAHNISALGTSDTIMISHPAGWARAVSAHEFSGLSATGTLDRTRYNGGFNSFADSFNTSTTSQADELLIGNISVEGPISDGFTLGAGYAGVYRIGTSAGFPDRTVNAQYRIVSATGNYSSTGALSSSRWWIASIVTYRAAATITVSGSCRQTDQTTNCNDTGTVRVAVNGVLQAQTQTTVAENWAISGIATPASGDVITVYIDSAANPREAVAVTKYDGTGNITGIELIEEHLTIGSDDNQTINNVDLGQYDNSVSGDEDIFHDVNGANHLTVDITGALAAEKLYLKSGNTFWPDSTGSGNVTTHDLEINGTFFSVNSINVSGSWDNNGFFIITGSTVNFTAGSGTETIDSSGSSFYNISFNDAGGTATYRLESALSVSNDLIVTDGILDTNSASNYAINVGNDFLQPGGQVLARSSTLTVARHFTADGDESETGYNSAALVMSGIGLLTYNNVTSYWTNGFNDLTVGQSGNTTTLANTRFCVLNMLTVGSGTFIGSGFLSDLYLRGAPNPLSFDVGSTINIDTLRFHNSLTQNIPPLVNGYDSNIHLTRNNGSVIQTGAITINSGSHLLLDGDAFADRIVTYNTNGFDLNVAGNIQIGVGNDTALKTLNGTNSNITVGGDFDIRNIGTGTQQALFIATNSTVTLNGAADQTITSSSSSFNNLVFIKSNNAIISDALDVNGEMVLALGNLDVATNNVDITVAGDWSHTFGSFTHGIRTVTLDGTNQLITGSTTFYNLTKSISSADTLSFESNSTQTIASGGTLTLHGVSGQLLTLNCPGCTSGTDYWNLNISSGAFKSIDYVNVSDADASGSDPSHLPINPANYSDGGSTISWFGSAVITVLKMSSVITDPVNGGSNPKRIPAAVIEYMVVPSNSGVASPDANTVVITDTIDATNVAFDVTTGVSFTDGTTSSGLSMGVVTYSSTPAPGPYVYDYIPSAGYDGNVTSIQVTTIGNFNYGGSPDPGFTLRYRVQIK